MKETVSQLKNDITPPSPGIKSHFVYILECADGSLYTGYATDVKKREWEHNNSDKGAKYTRCRRPCRVVYTEELGSRSEAQKRESAIKKLTRMKKLEIIAAGRQKIVDAEHAKE